MKISLFLSTALMLVSFTSQTNAARYGLEKQNNSLFGQDVWEHKLSSHELDGQIKGFGEIHDNEHFNFGMAQNFIEDHWTNAHHGWWHGENDWNGSGGFCWDEDTDPASGVVPVPAAIWLFGSALLGLFGIKRNMA
jgi:hypothetical protein